MLDHSLHRPAGSVLKPPVSVRRLLAGAKATAATALRRWDRRLRPLKTYTARAGNGVARTLNFRTGTSDLACIRQVFVERHYCVKSFRRAQEISDFIARRSALGQRPLIIDAGANIGSSAVFFAMTYPDAKIVAIEPEAGNFELLSKNTEGLGVGCLKAGLSSSNGHVKIVNPEATKWGFQTELTEEDTGIPLVTIPQIYEQECDRGNAYPFLVKIDIEGAESDVFARNVDWVAKTPILIVELHDWLFPKAGSSAGFLRCIAGQPRDIITFDENIYAIAHALE